MASVVEGFGPCLDGDGDGATGNTTPHIFAACALRTAHTESAYIGRLRRFNGLVAERTRSMAMFRWLSMSRLAILPSSPEGQRPIRNFRSAVRAQTTHYSTIPGTDKRGKKSHEAPGKKNSKAGRVQNLNLLLGAGKNNRNSLSRCPKHAQGKNRSSRDERKRDERGRMCDGRKESVAGRRVAERAGELFFFFSSLVQACPGPLLLDDLLVGTHFLLTQFDSAQPVPACAGIS